MFFHIDFTICPSFPQCLKHTCIRTAYIRALKRKVDVRGDISCVAGVDRLAGIDFVENKLRLNFLQCALKPLKLFKIKKELLNIYIRLVKRFSSAKIYLCVCAFFPRK